MWIAKEEVQNSRLTSLPFSGNKVSSSDGGVGVHIGRSGQECDAPFHLLLVPHPMTKGRKST